MADLTAERVVAAFDSLATGDRDRIVEYWAEDLNFTVPGTHAYAGRYESLDGFLGFVGNLVRLSGGSLNATRSAVLLNIEEGLSVDLNHITAKHAGSPADSDSPYDNYDIDALHLLRWENGRVVEGQFVAYGAHTEDVPLFWSPRNPDGSRREVV
jgi:ketosteroid isomerase-like protein